MIALLSLCALVSCHGKTEQAKPGQLEKRDHLEKRSLSQAERQTKTGSRSEAGSQTKAESRSEAKSFFEMPDIPAFIADTEGRMLYLAEHYWDKLDIRPGSENITSGAGNPASSSATFAEQQAVIAEQQAAISEQQAVISEQQSQIIEQAFADYASLLQHIPEEKAQQYVQQFIQRIMASPVWHDKMLQMAEKYLYDAGSPLLNESLYIPFAESAIAGGRLDEYHLDQMHYRLEVARKNRPGSPAADFHFIDENGQKSSLYQTAAPMLLLVFHDPICENCQAILSALQSSQELQALQAQGKLQVLLIYTEGDKAIWEQHKAHHPAGWISGFDAGESIKQQRLYELRAMPSLYLLDGEKKVILKDVLPEKLNTVLSTTRRFEKN